MIEDIDCIKDLCPGLKAPEGTIVFTMDVVGLYPSIPIQEGVDAVMEELENHLEQIDTLGPSLNEVRNLLQFVLSHNDFKFGHQVYHQIDRVSMGNNLAPLFAIIFMHTIETRLLQTAEIKPLVYKRYIDAILILWTYGRERLVQFVQLLNSYHLRIKFTYELSEVSDSVNSMDITIAVKESGELAYKLFQNPCSSGLLMDYASATPNIMKLPVASSQFLRVQRLSSGPQMRSESELTITKQLKLNHYPDIVINTS
ncbi:uncharacterized protein LOC135820078 [Sycon ciliatum]|uniref:uncharacterized protein LOC135820078 n=1 Tax=Sycon ciliatum TaxID=27933 RepID=UPI0031F6573F